MPKHRNLIAEIEVRGRFVHDEEIRLLSQGARNERKLALAAADFGAGRILQIRDGQGLKRFLGDFYIQARGRAKKALLAGSRVPSPPYRARCKERAACGPAERRPMRGARLPRRKERDILAIEQNFGQLWAFSRRNKVLRRVVLPAPFGPRRKKKSPLLTVNVKSLDTVRCAVVRIPIFDGQLRHAHLSSAPGFSGVQQEVEKERRPVSEVMMPSGISALKSVRARSSADQQIQRAEQHGGRHNERHGSVRQKARQIRDHKANQTDDAPNRHARGRDKGGA